MAKLRLNKNSKGKSRIRIDDILPRISGLLTVMYAQKEYKVIGYLDYRDKLILRDTQQQDCEIIVEMGKVKPLLRRMDSMTSKEKERYQELLDGVAGRTTNVWEVTEWLNDNQFDYKDLIGEGLAEEI